MKKFLLLITFLSAIVAYGQKTDATMKTSAVTIRDATVSGSNTATRVGTMFVDLVDNKKNVVDVITATGTNTYSITTPYVMTSITSGWSQKIKFTNGNTGSSTLTINTTIGPINIRKYVSGSPVVIASGDIPAGRIFELTYDGTNLQIDIAAATVVAADASTAGIAKLYTTTGSSTDGSMDQNSTTTALAAKLIAASNLSDLASASTARTNLGLGTLATQNGTSPSGTIVGTTDSQTLTNKTLTSPIINFGSDASGDIIIRSSGAYTRLPIGSNTQVLTISSGLPSWQSPVAGSSTFVGLTDGPGSFTGKSLNYPRVNVGETALEYRTASQIRSDIGAGTGNGDLVSTNNLSDLTNAGTARTNLGLGSLATQSITFGTGVATALAVNVGSAGAPILFNGVGGTPSSMTGTNITGIPESGVTNLTTDLAGKQSTIIFGTGVQTALGVNIGSAGAPVLFNGAGGTPSAIVLTNATGTAASLTAGASTALATGRTIGTITGDGTSAGSSFDGTGNNTNGLTLATVNSNVGTFGSSSLIPSFTVNAKGLITAVTTNAVASSQWTTTGSDIYYNTGNVMIGSTSAPSSKFHIVETSTSTPRGVLVDQYNTGTNGARITMRKARGSFSSPTVVVTGDALASWTASGYDGAAFIESSKMLVTSEGTINTNIVPSKIDLQTTNSSGTLTTGLSISSAQIVTLPAYTTNGGVHYNNGTGVLAQTGAGTSTTVLHGGTTPSYSAVSISADVSGLGSGVGTFLVTPSSSNLLAAVTDEVGNGPLRFANIVDNTQTASYTPVLADNGKKIRMNIATANTFTVPLHATTAFDYGTSFWVRNIGAGACTITPETGAVNLTTTAGTLIIPAGGEAVITQSSTAYDTWEVSNGTTVTGHALSVVNGTNVTGALSGTYGSSLLQDVTFTLGWSGSLAANIGGTGQTVYAVGDLLSANTTTSLSKVAAVASGSYLRSSGTSTLPVWSTLKLPNAATANYLAYATSTNTIGESANLIFDGTTLTVGGNKIKASATNDNAVAGNIGESGSSYIATGSAVSLTTATSANVTSVSLTAGDYIVSGIINYKETTSTVTARTGGLTSTSATVPTDGSEGNNGVQSTVTSEVNTITLNGKRFSLSGTTTIYLVAQATFSAGSCSAYGGLTWYRIR